MPWQLQYAMSFSGFVITSGQVRWNRGFLTFKLGTVYYLTSSWEEARAARTRKVGGVATMGVDASANGTGVNTAPTTNSPAGPLTDLQEIL